MQPRTEEWQPYLYCLMRTDLDSLNAGKAIAQGMHAGHVFTYHMGTLRDQFVQDWQSVPVNFRDYKEMADSQEITSRAFYNRITRNLSMFRQWEASSEQTPGFGVTITLDIGDEATLVSVVNTINALGYPASVAHDETYPVADGEVTHLLPVTTCGYAFGDKKVLEPLLSQFELHF